MQILLSLTRKEIYYFVPGGFAVGAEPLRRPGEAPREGVSSKNGWGWGGVMREIGALVQGAGWYKEVCVSAKNGPKSQLPLLV